MLRLRIAKPPWFYLSGMAEKSSPPIGAEEQLRQNVLELMEFHRMKQGALAAKLQRSQSWLSKRLSGKASGKGSRFQLADLDALATVFRVSPSELMERKYGKWDRRSGHERRSGLDRRRRPRTPSHDGNPDLDDEPSYFRYKPVN